MQSLFVYSSEFETIDNILSSNLEKPIVIGLSQSRFDNSLDILNYADKLTSTKPKKANTDTFFLSYKFKDFVKVGTPLLILVWLVFSLAAPLFFSL